jgi:hypothetical protein
MKETIQPQSTEDAQPAAPSQSGTNTTVAEALQADGIRVEAKDLLEVAASLARLEGRDTLDFAQAFSLLRHAAAFLRLPVPKCHEMLVHSLDDEDLDDMENRFPPLDALDRVLPNDPSAAPAILRAISQIDWPAKYPVSHVQALVRITGQTDPKRRLRWLLAAGVPEEGPPIDKEQDFVTLVRRLAPVLPRFASSEGAPRRPKKPRDPVTGTFTPDPVERTPSGRARRIKIRDTEGKIGSGPELFGMPFAAHPHAPNVTKPPLVLLDRF